MPIIRTLNYEIFGFLFALIVTFAWQILLGRISLKALLRRKDALAQLSPERIQLLLVVIAICGVYLTQAIYQINGRMPDLTNNWLYLFGASSTVYLVRKAWTTQNRPRD